MRDGFFKAALAAVLLACCCRAAAAAIAADDDPLFLTSFIEQGFLDQAKANCAVKLDDTDVKSCAGFLTVDARRGSNMFFWFFPAAAGAADAPVLLWLQGGPGMSSMYGLFNEHGPFALRNRTGPPVRRDVAWTDEYSVLYVDNPVGTGYSFTNEEAGYNVDQTAVGVNMHELLSQFFTLYPEYRKNDFYVTGESYAGKYVPAVAYVIHVNNPGALVKINLKGLIIGNGLVDPYHQMVYSEYLYQHGFIDDKEKEEFEDIEADIGELIFNGQYVEAAELFYTLVLEGTTYPYPSLFRNVTGMRCYYNMLSDRDHESNGYWEDFVQSPYMRKALHVGQLPFNNGSIVQMNLLGDKMVSISPWLSELLDANQYRFLLYSGQMDIIVPYTGTMRMAQALEWHGVEEFNNTKRKLWYVQRNGDGEPDDLAGYSTTYGNLTVLLVRNAGHMVPADQPVWSADFMRRFTSGQF